MVSLGHSSVAPTIGRHPSGQHADQSSAPHVRAGTNATLTRLPGGGFTVSLSESTKWEHPWQTRLWWLGDLNQWVATVRPGFVNGNAPVVNTKAATAQSLAGRFYNGLITARSGAADIARAAELAREGNADIPAGGTLDVKLYNNPPVFLPFRSVGFDSGGGIGSAVPTFFKNLGVNDAPVVDYTQPEAALKAIGQGAPKGNRLLRAADIIVHQPRLALTSTITLGAGIVTGFGNVTQTLSLRNAAPGDRLLVRATPLWDSTQPQIDPLSGDYTEDTWDELLVATVYLVSPPNAAPNSQPDGRWVPYVRHNLFWNLTYLPKTVLQVPQIDNSVGQLVALGSVLAGGVASFAVNFLAASLNDMTQNALNLLTGHSFAGTWWTATGGGSESEIPGTSPASSAATVAAPSNGWDKAARLQARSIAVARALKAARLDPPFPFRGVAFTPSLLHT